MKSLFQRSMITAATLVGFLAVAATPAAAIVGGQDAKSSYPGVTFVAVQYPGVGTAQCGGGLITPSIVLTAQHCVADMFVAPAVVAVPAANVSFRIGSNDRTAGGFEARAKKILLNPWFQWSLPGQPPSDFALVKLTRPVPARLMRLGVRHVDPGATVRAIGWGLTEYPVPQGHPLPTMLQQGDAKVLPASDCAGGGIDARSEICVAPKQCFGDSGNGVFVPDRTGWREVGLASRETTDPEDPTVNPCKHPMINTDVTKPKVQRWIADTIRTERTQPCIRPFVGTLDTATRARIDQLKPRLTR